MSASIPRAFFHQRAAHGKTNDTPRPRGSAMPPAVLHPDDDRAEAGPGVEPGVEHDELLGAAVYAHRGERGEHFVPISARISPGDQPRRPVGDDEQRVGLALDAMGRRLRSPRLPGVDVPGVDASMSPRPQPRRAMRWAVSPALRWLSLSWWWACESRRGRSRRGPR